MALVSSVIPNLLGGVSQQAPAARPRNASQYELNTRHSVVSGLTKRPSTDWISEIHTASDTDLGVSSHAFETADGKRFTLLIDDDGLGNIRSTVVDVEDGTKYALDMTPVADYFNVLPSDLTRGFKYLTIGDTTFILNRSVTPVEVPEQEDPNEVVPTTITVATYGDLPAASAQNFGTTAYVTDTQSYYVIQVFRPNYDGWGAGPTQNIWSYFIPYNAVTRVSPVRRGTVYIRQAVHDCVYGVTVTFADDTIAFGSYSTPEAVDGAGDPVSINTGDIAAGLASSLGAHANLTAVRLGSSVTITADKDIAKVVVTDEFGDQASRAYSDSVQQFNDLPPSEVEGRVVRISGSVDTGQDDYFVEYIDGLWKETVAFGEKTLLDPASMPITLVYDSVNDTFTFSYTTWPGRNSGDTESNPAPSFIGRTVNDMFLFKGRLCFLADENVIFSEVGNYENFYRSTLTQLLETDPIDVASTASRTSILKHGVAFDETLVLFADSQQFRILSGASLTPQNVAIAPTTTFNSSPTCSPISVGSNVFFVEDNSSSRYASVMEYYRNPNTDQDSAVAVTASVPKYIPRNILKIASAFNENLVAVLPKDNTGELYINSYYWVGGEKALSSWTTWKIKNAVSIRSINFFGDILYMAIEDVDGKIQLVSCNIEEGRYDEGLSYLFHMDFRVPGASLSPTYDGGTGKTEYTLPFGTDVADAAVLVVTETTGDDVEGSTLTEDSRTSTSIFVDGDTTAIPVMFGLTYDFIYDFSPQFVRVNSGNGEVVRQNGRLSLRYMNLRFDDTSYFDVQITPEGRSTWTTGMPSDFYTSQFLQSQEGQTDISPVRAGNFRFSCKGKADAVNIRIINSTIFPCGFSQAEWDGQYNPKTRAI